MLASVVNNVLVSLTVLSDSLDSIYLAVHSPCIITSVQDKDAFWPISTSGIWPHQTSAPMVRDRPQATLLTCVIWQDSKAAYSLWWCWQRCSLPAF